MSRISLSFRAALVLGALALTGCEHVVDVDPNDAIPLVALDAAFEPDSALQLSVFRTQALGSAVDPSNYDGRIRGATAKLTDPRGRTIPFETGGYGGYILEERLVAGEAYTLTVEAPDLPRATSTFRIPVPVGGFTAVAGPIENQAFEVVVRFQDPPGEGDRYTLSVFAQRPGRLDGEQSYRTLDPSIRDESFWETIQTGPGGRSYYRGLFSDALFDGRLHEVRLQVDLAQQSNDAPVSHYVVELRVCSQAYFDQQRTGGYRPLNPFSEVSAPPSNVEGGLGTVGAFVRQRVVL